MKNVRTEKRPSGSVSWTFSAETFCPYRMAGALIGAWDFKLLQGTVARPQFDPTSIAIGERSAKSEIDLR